MHDLKDAIRKVDKKTGDMMDSGLLSLLGAVERASVSMFVSESPNKEQVEILRTAMTDHRRTTKFDFKEQ